MILQNVNYVLIFVLAFGSVTISAADDDKKPANQPPAKLLAVTGICTADDKKDEKKKDAKDLIQGEWVVVKSTIQQQIGEMLTLKGDEWTNPMGQAFTIVIDDTKNPKHLDLTSADNANEKFLGIYKIEDGKLTFCREKAARGVRPTEFKATPSHDLLVLKRPSQLDLIQGEWIVVDSTVPQQIAKKITVKGNEWTNPMGQKSTIAITIGDSKKPKQLDTWATDNARFLGIYKIEDGKLTFCREKVARGIRPTEFKATPSNDLLVLKRPTQLELIQGEWVVVDPNGPQQIAKKITVKGNELTNPMGQKSTIVVDDSKRPKQLDLISANNADEKFLAIFKIEDGKLTFCREKAALGVRPTEFKATPSNDLLVLKRPSQLELMQGEWVVVESNLPQQMGKSLSVKGDEWSRPAAGRQFTITIDDSTNPKQLDLTFPESPRKAKLLAIYKVEDDKFTVCREKVSLGIRPTEFKATPSNDLLVFKRASQTSPPAGK